MLNREGVDLHAGFLDGLWLRGQVQYSLPDSAGHVETINYVLIVVLPLSVRARVHLLFRGVVVHAGCRTSGGAGPQTRCTGGHRYERDEIASYDRQLCNTFVIQSEFIAAIRRVDDRRFGTYDNGLTGGAHLQRDRKIEVLFGQKRDVCFRLGKPRGFDRDLVVSRSKTHEAVVARGIGSRSLLNSRSSVDKDDLCFCHSCPGWVLNDALDVRRELRKGGNNPKCQQRTHQGGNKAALRCAMVSS